MVAEQFNDYCPSCGKDGIQLHPVSGFCISCTKQAFPTKAVCERCGRIESRGQFRTKCQVCQREEWLKENADRLEAYMITGMTFAMAVVKVLSDNRPLCLSCGKKIKGGTRGRHFFCRTTPLCRSAGTKFKHLKEKGIVKSEALTQTVQWVQLRRENGSNKSAMERAS